MRAREREEFLQITLEGVNWIVSDPDLVDGDYYRNVMGQTGWLVVRAGLAEWWFAGVDTDCLTLCANAIDRALIGIPRKEPTQ